MNNSSSSRKATTPSPMTYREAGVDIDAADRLIDTIRPAVQSTRRPEVQSGLGGFGALFALDRTRYRHPLLVSTTDGVGTKLKLAFLMDRHETIGIDLVAMSVNDLIVQGAEPLFFLDYFATGTLETDKAATVIQGITDGCQQSGCALIGGETAEMPDFYSPGEYDLAGFAVGIVERDRLITGRHILPGDAVIGIASNGPHANGYSLIRRLILNPDTGPGLEAPFEESTLGEKLLTPTRIYVRSILSLVKRQTVKGIAHITGGGFLENIPRILPEKTMALLSTRLWPRHPVFNFLQQLGSIEESEMLRTFNCGIGMVVIVPDHEAKDTMARLSWSGEKPFYIGNIHARNSLNDPQIIITDA